MPSSSKRENAWRVFSCLSSSLIPWEESLNQAMRNPTELFVAGTSKAHLQNTWEPTSSTVTCGLPGGGGGNTVESWPGGMKAQWGSQASWRKKRTLPKRDPKTLNKMVLALRLTWRRRKVSLEKHFFSSRQQRETLVFKLLWILIDSGVIQLKLRLTSQNLYKAWNTKGKVIHIIIACYKDNYLP